MAEKGFGVKEINLIGPSGTPTIESPNNLNLNAVNVAISTNVSIGGTLTVSGNVSVGGTLTYEDVTNIDSVGIITARDHVVVGGGLSVVGISTFSDIVKIMSGLDLQTNGTLDIIGSTSTSGLDIQSSSSVQIGQNGFPNNDYATFSNGGCTLYTGGTNRLQTTSTGVTIAGALTAGGLTYPSSNGNNGDVLTSDGTGNVTWQASSGGGGSQSRTTASVTQSIANNGVANVSFTTAKAMALMKIETSHAAWVTLYSSTGARTNDAGRLETTDPTPGSGVLSEVITTGNVSQLITPATVCFNEAGATTTYAKIVNKSGSTANVQVTLTYVQLEA